eukprot:s42_g39.t2
MQDKKTKKKKYTVSSEFKDQLSSLMDVVDLTEPHFIRCIKPNPQNVPDLFDRKGVTEQLRYGGVLQVVQVSRAGYPVRINHQECWDDYKVIGAPKVVSELRHIQDPKIRAQKLLDHLDSELNLPKPKHGQSWAVGKTLVFFKLPAYERIKFARQKLREKAHGTCGPVWALMSPGYDAGAVADTADQSALQSVLQANEAGFRPGAGLSENGGHHGFAIVVMVILGIQGFWFGAKRPRDRKLFRFLHQRLASPLRRAAQCVNGRRAELTLPQQFQLAIFLDQQSRNERAVVAEDDKQELMEVEDLIESCSKIARQLADEAALQTTQETLSRLESHAYALDAMETHQPSPWPWQGDGARPLDRQCLAPRCGDELKWLQGDCWRHLTKFDMENPTEMRFTRIWRD